MLRALLGFLDRINRIDRIGFGIFSRKGAKTQGIGEMTEKYCCLKKQSNELMYPEGEIL